MQIWHGVDYVRKRQVQHPSVPSPKRGKKIQRLTSDHVDGISLLGWHYKDNGLGESSKRIRCVLKVEGQRHEEESEMVAL